MQEFVFLPAGGEELFNPSTCTHKDLHREIEGRVQQQCLKPAVITYAKQGSLVHEVEGGF